MEPKNYTLIDSIEAIFVSNCDFYFFIFLTQSGLIQGNISSAILVMWRYVIECVTLCNREKDVID